ncbi:hypothetical protein VP01_5502g1, partial [Puccinia sorghi]
KAPGTRGLESEALLKPATNRKRCIRMLPKKEKIMLTFTNPPKGLPINFYHPDGYRALPDSQQKLIPNLEKVVFYAAESLQPKAMRHADEKFSDKSFTCKYWEILFKPYGLLNEDSSIGSGDKESDDNCNNAGDNCDHASQDSESKGHKLDEPSPDNSSEKYFEEGEAGNFYNKDSGMSHDEDTDGDEEYTGVRSGDDEEDSDEEMEDKTMGTVTYGVDLPLLERMEEEENGWCGKDTGKLSGYISEDQGVIQPNQRTRKGFGWTKRTKRCSKMRGKITQICVEDN